MLEAQTLSGGFVDPVIEAQSIFRQLMDAMAHPATIARVNTTVQAPDSLPIAQAAIALTLLDHETPAWLAPSVAQDAVRAWVTFHTGVALTEVMSDARFAFLGKSDPLPDFIGFELGSPDYPDRSATLIVEVEALEGGPPLHALGPGIDGSRTVSPRGLPPDFVRRWMANHASYPRGLDLILTADRHFMCMPRTTSLIKTEA